HRAPRPAPASAPAPPVEAPEESAGATIATPGVGASTAPTRLTPAPTAPAAGLSATTGSTSATESSTRPEAPVSASAAAAAIVAQEARGMNPPYRLGVGTSAPTGVGVR